MGEANADVPLTVLLTDVFSNEQRVVAVDAFVAQPFTVTFDELLDERRYRIDIQGVDNASEAHAIVTTLPANPSALNVVALSDDAPAQLGGAPSGWTKLSKMVKVCLVC